MAHSCCAAVEERARDPSNPPVWVGDGRQNDNRTYYLSCIVRGRRLDYSDTVVLRPKKMGDPPRVGRIVLLWEQEDGVKRVQGRRV